MIGPGKWLPLVTAGMLSLALLAGAIYGKLSARLGGEHFNIARALHAGHGYADPFGRPDGPTAWMAPVFPALMATLYWLGDGSPDVVRAGVVCLHTVTLIATGIFVLVLARQTAQRIGVAILFFLATLYHFQFWFLYADDPWLMMLSLNLLIAGVCWLSPLASRSRAAAWGVLGGLCCLINPIVGFTWAGLSLCLGVRQRTWSRLAVTFLCGLLTVAPWTIRNYLVLGRLIPVKSNLAFELYQSHCLQPDGLLQNFYSHPGGGGGAEGFEYREVGEIAFMDHKWRKVMEAVAGDPEDFLNRLSDRFLGATLWYVPFNRAAEADTPWLLWARRLAHPLPFLALLLLVFTSMDKPLSVPQWTVIGVYVLYLLPYIVISYYERYAIPLLAVKVLLVTWGLERLLAVRQPQ